MPGNVLGGVAYKNKLFSHIIMPDYSAGNNLYFFLGQFRSREGKILL